MHDHKGLAGPFNSCNKQQVSTILSIIKQDKVSSKFKRGPVAQLGRAPDF